MISISGIGFGLQFGLCKESFALVLTDKSVIHTLAQGRDFSFGKSVEITVGPTKLDDQYQISEREHLGGKTYVYAKKNGVYIAAALNATILSSRRKSNGILYDNLTTEEILEGDRADVPEEFLPLIQVIKDQTHDNPSYDQE
jgi:lipid-binding SYLF domain-containing protein